MLSIERPLLNVYEEPEFGDVVRAWLYSVISVLNEAKTNEFVGNRKKVLLLVAHTQTDVTTRLLD